MTILKEEVTREKKQHGRKNKLFGLWLRQVLARRSHLRVLGTTMGMAVFQDVLKMKNVAPGRLTACHTGGMGAQRMAALGCQNGPLPDGR